MTDNNGTRLIVQTIGNAGPFLKVRDDDAKQVAQFFDKHYVAFDLFDGELTLPRQEPQTVLNFGIQTSADFIQGMLDAQDTLLPLERRWKRFDQWVIPDDLE